MQALTPSMEGMNASTNQLISNYISQENRKNAQPVAL
jgi:hypothetical protein